jgi:hypothetical protein
LNAILFSLALNATEAEVLNVVDTILTHFDIDYPTTTVSPATVAAAQTAPAAAPTANDTTLDKSGLPWNAEIHSASKGINADGTWRKRKGVDAGTVARVEAQLRGAAPAAAATVTAPAPVAVAVPTIAIPGANVPKSKYTLFCEFLSANTAPNGKLNPEWLDAVFAQNNTSLAALATADDATLQAYWDAIAGTLG